ncbi:hypothetical protein [Metabacillus idriensis]|uniref:hypothetical protein n=1 Tax=Metabacillus idriensis TaxID=324768 RepID=UPI001748D285|nr:hypothetical protein [Metabacillus idriensis]
MGIKKQQKKDELSEQEKLAKTGNFIVKGIALWFLLPFFGLIAILGLFFFVWIWDMIF